MRYIKKLTRSLLLAMVLVFACATFLAMHQPQPVAAAARGTCELQLASAAGSEITRKPCTELAQKFKDTALSAVSSQKCYTYRHSIGPNSQTNITLEARGCGDDAIGTCTDIFSSPRTGDNLNSKKACVTMSDKFANAANGATAAGRCYIISEFIPVTGANRLAIEAKNCGSSDSVEIGGQDFDDGRTPDGTIEGEADAAFGGCQGGGEAGACGIVEEYINPAINLLAGAVGLAVVIMIIIGGIQYSSAGGDAGKVAAAKGRIFNALFALFAFLFLYAVLQWLVPGGAF